MGRTTVYLQSIPVAKHILGFHDQRHTEFLRYREDIAKRHSSILKEQGYFDDTSPQQKMSPFRVSDQLRSYAIDHPAMRRFRSQLLSRYHVDDVVGGMLKTCMEYLLVQTAKNEVMRMKGRINGKRWSWREERLQTMEHGTRTRQIITPESEDGYRSQMLSRAAQLDVMNGISNRTEDGTKAEQMEIDDEDLYSDDYRDRSHNQQVASTEITGLQSPPSSEESPAISVVQKLVTETSDVQHTETRPPKRSALKLANAPRHRSSQTLSKSHIPIISKRGNSSSNNKTRHSGIRSALVHNKDIPATAPDVINSFYILLPPPPAPNQKGDYQTFLGDSTTSQIKSPPASPGQPIRSSPRKTRRVNYDLDGYFDKILKPINLRGKYSFRPPEVHTSSKPKKRTYWTWVEEPDTVDNGWKLD